MPNTAQLDLTTDTQSQNPTNAESIPDTEQLGDESVSEHMKGLLGAVGFWLTDFLGLVSAEASLAAASLSRLFLLSILFAQTIVLFVVFAFIVTGLVLQQTFGLSALELSTAGLVAAGIMVLILRKLMRSVRKNLLPAASINQLQSGISDLNASLDPKPETVVDKPEGTTEKNNQI